HAAGVHLLQASLHLDARVRVQDVDAPVVSGEPLDDVVHGTVVGNVERRALGATSIATNGIGRGVGGRVVEVGDHDHRTLGGQDFGAGASDTGAGGGDQGDPTLENHSGAGAGSRRRL